MRGRECEKAALTWEHRRYLLPGLSFIIIIMGRAGLLFIIIRAVRLSTGRA